MGWISAPPVLAAVLLLLLPLETMGQHQRHKSQSHDQAYNSIISKYYTTDPFFAKVVRSRSPRQGDRRQVRKKMSTSYFLFFLKKMCV